MGKPKKTKVVSLFHSYLKQVISAFVSKLEYRINNNNNNNNDDDAIDIESMSIPKKKLRRK